MPEEILLHLNIRAKRSEQGGIGMPERMPSKFAS
jgi:hypothetical protein